jgi:hypothetical protein
MLKKSIQRRRAFMRRLRFIEIPTALPQLRFGFAGADLTRPGRRVEIQGSSP